MFVCVHLIGYYSIVLQVVMDKGGVKLDMRGRCSAGQKVLKFFVTSAQSPLYQTFSMLMILFSRC